MKKTDEVIPMPHVMAANLTRLRKEKSWKQRHVAEKLDLKLSTYQSYEEGRAEPPIMILFKIKSIHNLQTVEELFY